VFFPIDNHSRDLLIHEYKNAGEECRENGGKDGPRWIPAKGINEPSSVILPRRLKFFRYG
jgi:hypothetical protein